MANLSTNMAVGSQHDIKHFMDGSSRLPRLEWVLAHGTQLRVPIALGSVSHYANLFVRRYAYAEVCADEYSANIYPPLDERLRTLESTSGRAASRSTRTRPASP